MAVTRTSTLVASVGTDALPAMRTLRLAPGPRGPSTQRLSCTRCAERWRTPVAVDPVALTVQPVTSNVADTPATLAVRFTFPVASSGTRIVLARVSPVGNVSAGTDGAAPAPHAVTVPLA